MSHRQPRAAYGAWIERAGSKPGFYLAESLSSQGLTLRTEEPFEPGLRVDVQLVVENEARVLRGEAEVFEGSALRFVDLDASDRLFLEELLSEI